MGLRVEDFGLKTEDLGIRVYTPSSYIGVILGYWKSKWKLL